MSEVHIFRFWFTEEVLAHFGKRSKQSNIRRGKAEICLPGRPANAGSFHRWQALSRCDHTTEGRTPLPPSTRKRIIDSTQIALSICQNSIYIRQKTIYTCQKTIYTRQKTIYIRQKTIYIRQKTIYIRQKSIYVHKMRAASVKSSLTFIKYTLHAK